MVSPRRLPVNPDLIDISNLGALEAEIARRRKGQTVSEEATALAKSLRAFVPAAWHLVWPNQQYTPGWHIDAIADELEAVSAGDVRKLQIWVPPGSSKSTVVSIMWPAWEWTREPWLRYITASYDQDLSTRFAVQSRELLRSDWYQARWPKVNLKKDQDLKRSYANTAGGERYATSPGSIGGTAGGTGRHAHRIVIDDPINAAAVTSETALAHVADWHDGTISTRFANPKTGVEVIIQQRLDERDLAGHVLEQDDWRVLCLPEEYEPSHPFVWPDDPRSEPGELLMPERIGPAEHDARVRVLGAHRAAGQLQQRPAAREGAILKRSAWLFFPKAWIEDDGYHYLPKFTSILQSWDTSFKDHAKADYVAGGLWGLRGPDLYLLDITHKRMGLSATKDAMRSMAALADRRWPRLPMKILIEKSANGVEIIEELKREIRGVIAIPASTSKELRAEAAEPALESGNIFVPGQKAIENPSGYNETMTPEFTQQLIESCAVFPNGQHDDLVDMFTQVVNWSRGRKTSGVVSGASISERVPAVGVLAGIDSWD